MHEQDQEQILYYASRSSLTTVHPMSGKQLWRQEITTRPLYGKKLLFVDDVLYLGGWDGSVVAVDGKTRRTLWQYEENEVRSLEEMAVCGDVIALRGYGERQLHVLQATTGRLLWGYGDTLSHIRQHKLTRNAVYVCGQDEEIPVTLIRALDLETGKELWKSAYDGLVTAHEEMVYVTENIHPYNIFRLHALQPENGQTIWTTDTFHVDSQVRSGSVIDDILYIVTRDHLFALDVRTGKQLWKREYPLLLREDRGRSITLLTSQGHLFTMQTAIEESRDDYDECLYCLWSIDKATGRTLWKVREGGDDVLSSANQDVIFLSAPQYPWWEGYRLRAVSKKDGSRLWEAYIDDLHFKLMACT